MPADPKPQTFKRLDDYHIMPWGKYKGKFLEDVPGSYLLWLESEMMRSKKKKTDFQNGLLVYIEENRDFINAQVNNK